MGQHYTGKNLVQFVQEAPDNNAQNKILLMLS